MGLPEPGSRRAAQPESDAESASMGGSSARTDSGPQVGRTIGGSPPGLPPLPPLRALPLTWRLLLAGFLIFLGAGYVVAQLNVLLQNQLVDGKPGLSLADLTLKYHGGYVARRSGEAAPSRMLEMIQGAMRQYIDTDAEFEALAGWLRAGATREAFASGPDPTPHDVLFKCLRCHAAEGGKAVGRESPFGPDLFTLDYAMVSKFTLAGGAGPGEVRVWRPPMSWHDLTMTTHAHVFAVPTFLVILGALYLWAGWPAGRARRAVVVRGVLACAPLAFFLIDMACWWLARLPGVGIVFVPVMATAAVMFGTSFVIQWVVVFRALLTRRRAMLT